MDALGTVSAINSIMGSKPSKVAVFNSVNVTVGTYAYAIVVVTYCMVSVNTGNGYKYYSGAGATPLIIPHGSSLTYTVEAGGSDMPKVNTTIGYSGGVITTSNAYGYALLYN